MKFDLEQFKNGVKARTRDGRIATFVGICEQCADHSSLIVHLEGYSDVDSYCADGTYDEEEVTSADLVSMVSHWEDVSIDAKVRVRDPGNSEWENRYFAGLDEYGRPTVWNNGATSWSSRYEGRSNWVFMELVEL